MKKSITILLFLSIIIGSFYIYFSPTFEKNPPKIAFEGGKYWNLRDRFVIHITDESPIKFYRVTLINNDIHKVLKTQQFLPSENKKDIKINIKLPQFYQIKGNKITLKVEAVDSSKWNWFAGNEAHAKDDLIVDTIYPTAEVINNSYSIAHGGSAVAIVKVKDENLKEAYIKITDRDNPTHFYKFKLTPFYKKDYYISLLAWPYNFSGFSADLIVKDKANNISKSHIPLRWKLPKYVHRKIKISENFIKRVDIPILQKMNMNIPNDLAEVFKIVNEKIRKINEENIYKITNSILEQKVNNFYLHAFRPMKGATKEAGYGEQRSYIFDNQIISHAIHKGLDLASFRHAKIYASNAGKVIFEGWLGIYGNTLALYHKLGLVSTYSHCSSFNVERNSNVYRGSIIAHTGSTGAVFGDHLHFGIYIQGIPVQPLEWMDSNWIKSHIINVIISAKRTINK